MHREKVILGVYEMLQRDTWKDIDKERHRFQPVLNDVLGLLKKQIPIPVKDVQWCEVTRKRMINGICPSCNSVIVHFNGSRFCDKCGQAVKWE